MERRLLTYEEAADQLQLKRSTIEEWARSGKIPCVRISARVVRFDLDDVIAAVKRPRLAKAK